MCMISCNIYNTVRYNNYFFNYLHFIYIKVLLKPEIKFIFNFFIHQLLKVFTIEKLANH